MAKSSARIEVDGLKQFNRVARKAADRELPKRIGQANKATGALVISKLPPGDPAAVGAGSGATVRPSATKREVLLRVGGAHRVGQGTPTRMQPWGRRIVANLRGAPQRPHIMGAVEQNSREIEEFYLEAVEKAMTGSGPFET